MVKKSKSQIRARTRSTPTVSTDTSMTVGEKMKAGALIAGVLGAFGLMVGTKTGRSICCDAADAMAAVEQARRDAGLNREVYRVELLKLFLDKKLQLCRLEAHSTIFNDPWAQKNLLRREIEVLEEAVRSL